MREWLKLSRGSFFGSLGASGSLLHSLGNPNQFLIIVILFAIDRYYNIRLFSFKIFVALSNPTPIYKIAHLFSLAIIALSINQGRNMKREETLKVIETGTSSGYLYNFKGKRNQYKFKAMYRVGTGGIDTVTLGEKV